MPRVETVASYRNPALRELLAVVVLTAVFFCGAAYFELFEWLVEFPIHHKEWHLPAISGTLLFAAIGLGALAIRWWFDLGEVNGRLSAICSELKREKEGMQIVSQMTDLLQSCLSLAESSRIVGKSGQQAFPHHVGGIYLLKNSRNLLEPWGIWGESGVGEGDGTFAPNDCWALRRGLPHLSETSGDGPRCLHLDGRFKGWALCVPMAAMGETIGVLHLRSGQTDSTRVGNPDLAEGTRDERFAVRFAAAAATALANLKLRETLRYQSVRDPLTGLFNRRYLEELLNMELGRAIRKLRPLGIIMVDADHFKQINDRFGHEAGDKILRTLAAVLAKAVRKEDLACRYGGEEFVLVLPEATQEVAYHRAERMVDEVRNLIVNHDGQRVGPITISAGVAAFPDHGATAESLLQSADAALYLAKAQGRDRVVLAASPETPCAESVLPSEADSSANPASPLAAETDPVPALPGPPPPRNIQ